MSLKILVAAEGEAARYRERWNRNGIRCVAVGFRNVMNLIHAPASADTVFDAIAFCGEDDPDGEADTSEMGTPEDALAIATAIRLLPASVAMFDGKQWRSIPIIVVCPFELHSRARSWMDESRSSLLADVELFSPTDSNNFGGSRIKELVEDYRAAVLSEFDNLGFIVHHERGRYVVGPALKSHKELEGRYYFGPADKRPKGFVTVHKDHFGIQVEVEKFEALINKQDVREQELQQFFEDHPHFLSETHTPLSQVRLSKNDGSVLIPDFILKPIFAQQRDSQWELLELKLPKEGLLSGKGSRKKLSSQVIAAMRQLRDYKEHLQEGSHAREVAAVLGHPLRYPRLGVLIGRLANTDAEALDRELDYQADVRIVTYDEILDRQQAQIDR